MHRAQADDRGVDRADIAGDDRLRRGDDMAGNQNGIDGLVRVRTVSAAAFDVDLDAVGGRHHRSRSHGDLPRRQAGPVVQRVHLIRREALEQPVVDHGLAAAETFLARLKNEIRRAVESPRARQVAGRA